MDKSKLSLREILGIKYPIIVAPMFLVSNEAMIIAACNSGATAAIPALNYRSVSELRKGIKEIKKQTSAPFGINLIVNKSNIYFLDQLKVCCEEKVAFIITSLGSPELVINEAHKEGIKVFCDVTDVGYAKKVEELGADALIAVNNIAGGHAGRIDREELIKVLTSNTSLPIINAGGVGTANQIEEVMKLGVAGFSIGSIFIATDESPVSNEYKQAVVDYGAKDIVMTTKLSGTPCTVINTPYVQKIGTKQNFLEKLMSKNKTFKKWIKAIVFLKGMNSLKKAAFSATYKTLWCAGPSIQDVKEIKPLGKVIEDLAKGFK